MALEGKGLYIWKIESCAAGDPTTMAAQAQQAGLSHVILKVADGPNPYNTGKASNVIDALRHADIVVWGWQYIYADNPMAEAEMAVRQVLSLGLDGLVINAEASLTGQHRAAAKYIDSVVTQLKSIPIALSSFRYPLSHDDFPWTEFLSRCTMNAPQIYWGPDGDPVEQLDRSIQQFKEIYPIVPVVPTGSAFSHQGGRPTASQITRFLSHVRSLGLKGASLWNWDYAGSGEGRDLWDAIASFDWPNPRRPETSIALNLFAALKRHDMPNILSLYSDTATLVTPTQTLHGRDAIASHFSYLIGRHLSGSSIEIKGSRQQGDEWQIVWSLNELPAHTGMTNTDTIGIRDGLIQYHLTSFRVG